MAKRMVHPLKIRNVNNNQHVKGAIVMKGAKFLTSAVIAGMMVSGAGYAYWTDAITVDNTVSTGELKVEFTDSEIASNETGKQYIVTNDTFDAKGLSFSVDNLYPGAGAKFSASFENTGSIPAVAKKPSLEFGGNGTPLTSEQRDLIMITGGKIIVKDDNGEERNSWTIKTGFSINQADQALSGQNGKYPLEPGDVVHFENIELTMHKDADESFEDKDLDFNLELQFSQHNE
ncbi:SipW-dependent-type signal peptide-containing protein [Halobacillus litoralis]|uniref:SipW-dependent-type signal peptide-containing protein n=1 Tax=Halobacillus litoralis TaxID=45668 RepID=UPI001CD47DD4|nr:SipW-dependent-type signal peptide-containing protein [Halobacillus litoralis]MCA0971755.1 SipW-dependent-type signal peptide-containing protein [Halobacillus litoralis]